MKLEARLRALAAFARQRSFSAAAKMLANMVQREAMVLTFNDLFLVMAGVFLTALLFMPLVRKPQQKVAADH